MPHAARSSSHVPIKTPRRHAGSNWLEKRSISLRGSSVLTANRVDRHWFTRPAARSISQPQSVMVLISGRSEKTAFSAVES